MATIRIFAVTGFVLTLAGCASVQGHNVRHAAEEPSYAGSEAAWNALDTNHDGALSMNELVTQHAMALIQDMPNADSNHDGRVSREEWNHWWPRMTTTKPSPTMAQLNEQGPVSHLAR